MYIIEHSEGLPFARFHNDDLEDRYKYVGRDGAFLTVNAAGDFIVKPLGYGGYGRVVRCKDRLSLDRAIKFIDSRELISDNQDNSRTQFFTPGYTPVEDDIDLISRRLQDEIRYTNARPFQRILQIIDYGKVRDVDGRNLIYYVSTFLPGDIFNVFWTSRLATLGTATTLPGPICDRLHDLLFDLIDDILAGLDELSDAQVVHMDIKPPNIMVLPAADDESPKYLGRADRLFLIDLGAARSWTEAKSDEVAPLITTPYFFPEHLLPSLGYANGCIRLAALRSFGYKIDLYAAGRTLELLVLDRVRRMVPFRVLTEQLRDTEVQKEEIWRQILRWDFEVVEGLISRLMTTGKGGFSSTAEARLAFQSIGKSGLRNPISSRILTDQILGINIRISDALVRIAPPFHEIVDHSAFQRLKRLHQLAILHQVFPDATHSRFSHVLSTYQTTKLFLLALNRDASFRLNATRRDVEHILAASLLHDIGQYAFSHTIEDLRKLGDKFGVENLKTIKHDQELAYDYVLNRNADGQSVRGILEEAGYSCDDILYMFQKSPKDPAQMIGNLGRDLVSGSIDVDRVSYLLQDSDRTGVPYGRAVDRDLLAETLCVRDDNGTVALAVDEAGISSVEAVMTAVYWMYRNVYWRHTNRGFMAAVKHVMCKLLQRNALTFEEYHREVYGQSDHYALEFLHRRYLGLLQNEGLDAFAPLRSLVEGDRFSYRRVFTLSRDGDREAALYESIVQRGSLDKMAEVVQAMADALPHSVKVKDGEILIDIPLKKRLRNENEPSGFDVVTRSESGISSVLWIRKRDHLRRKQSWLPLREASQLIQYLSSIEDHSGRKIRVFLSRDLLVRMPQKGVELLGATARSSLDAVFGNAS